MDECRLTPAAETDLEMLWTCAYLQGGAEQAHVYTDHITALLSELAKTPEMAEKCDDIREHYRRWRIDQRRVYFRLADYGIEIIRILYASQKTFKHFYSMPARPVADAPV